MILFISLTWKWVYYAPNTYKHYCLNKLQKKNESLSSINDQMETRNDQLEQMIIDMQKEMIEKLTELKNLNRKV